MPEHIYNHLPDHLRTKYVRILECNIARTKNKPTLHNMKWRLYNLKREANANK